MPAVRDVLVVGGGIAGMTLATALTRSGIRAEIVELTPEWSVLGIGISIQGATLRALKTIGVLDRIVNGGFGYSSAIACDVRGKVTGVVNLPPLLGAGYPECVGIMRPLLQQVLRDAMIEAKVPVRLGVTVTSLEQHADRVDAAFTDGTRGSYDLVVGADGVNSKVRELIFGAHIKAKDIGQAVWRAMVRRPPEVRARYMFYGPRNKAGFNPVSEREMYIFLVQNLRESRHIPDEELPGMMRGLLADFGGLVAEVRDQVTDPRRIAYRPMSSMLLPPPWYRGRVVLVGDAVHTPTPQMASGAGIAIEDTIVLNALLQKDEPLPVLLEQFMARRYERCRMVVESSLQLSEWEKTPDLPGADPVGVMARANAALAAPI
jgi:2-polyprenyl-6-methoxyphenol hydroxylase-like FAD-dependent oxidoreductase